MIARLIVRVARSSLRWLGIALIHVALFLVVHAWLRHGTHFLGWDAVFESWGDLVYGRKALASGALPLWNPHERGGYPFLADPQTGVLYPLNWIVYGAAWLFGDGYWLALLRPLIHYAVLATGMHALLGWLEMKAPARWFGGAAIVLAGRFAKSKDSAGLWSPVWLPWVMLAVYLCVRKPSLRSGVVLAVVTSFAFYSGYPPNVFRIYLAAAVIGVVLLHEAWQRTDRDWRHVGRVGTTVGIGALIAAALALPVAAATLDILPHTVRAGLQVRDVIDSAVRPYMWTELFFPRLFRFRSYGYPYAGMLTAFLAVLALARPNRIRIACLVVGAFFFLLGCGHRSPVLPFFVEYVPGFRLWRIPEQYLFVVNFAWVWLAASGLDDVLRADAEQRRRLARVLYGLTGVVFVCGFVAALIHMSLPRALEAAAELQGGPRHGTLTQIRIAWAGAGLALVCGALIHALLRDSRRWRVAAFALAIPVLAADLAHSLSRTYGISQPVPDTHRDALLADIELPPGARIADDWFFGWRVSARTGVSNMLGRDSTMVSARYRKFSRVAPEDYRLLAHSGVRYYAGRNGEKLRAQAKESVIVRQPGIYELTAAPYAWWTPDVELLDSSDAVFDRLRESQPGRTAYVSRGDVDPATAQRLESLGGNGAPVPAIVQYRGWNVINLEIEAPRAGLVVILESWFPGWQIRIDGKAARHLRAQYLFGATEVSAGHHRIEMRYRPTLVLIGLWIWVLTWIGLLVFALWSIWPLSVGRCRDAATGSNSPTSLPS